MLSDIPKKVLDVFALNVKNTVGTNVNLISFSFCGGGCINHGGELKTSAGSYFVKWNNSSAYPGMFEQEAKGLALLHSKGELHIPIVLFSFDTPPYQGIAMDFVHEGTSAMDYWEKLGQGLAGMHTNTSATFGLDHDNYIGSLPQQNNSNDNWIEFFIEQRLLVQVDRVVNSGLMGSSLTGDFELLFPKLPDLLPVEKPSLIHGDLWSGNLITDKTGQPCLIDPAVYFGHREAEIAFTKLFGGFNSIFYDSYNQTYRLEPGFEERVDIYNLYPLLVHANLFGSSYLIQVRSILKKFT